MKSKFPLSEAIWERTPVEARELVLCLMERVGELETKVKELETRLNQNSSNSSNPPSSDPLHIKRSPPPKSSGRKRGGQRGHERQSRALVGPEEVEEVVDVKPAVCRRCSYKLSGEDAEPLRHQVAELPRIKPVVTEYRLYRLRCQRCETVTCACLPEGVPTSQFGPRLQATLGLMAGAYRMSKRSIQALAKDVLGLSIATGAICKLEQWTEAALQAPAQELRQHIQVQPVRMDETAWWEGGVRAWLWVTVTRWVTVFTIAAHRSAQVAQAILGIAYACVLTCDRYSAYYWVANVQWCWAHLRRDFQAMIDRRDSGSHIGRALLADSDQMFHWWHRVRDGTLARSTFQTYMRPLQRRFRETLEQGGRCKSEKTAATCRELLKREARLWTFVKVEGIEPTNNEAERALRPAVLFRKTNGGTDSTSGSRYMESLLSVVATSRQQGRNVLDFITACCEARTQGKPAPSLLPSAAGI